MNWVAMTINVTTEHLEELQGVINALKAKDTPRALETLQGITKTSPHCPEALHLLGLCSLILGDLGRSIELINAAHKIDPECRDYVDALATLKAKAGALTESLYFAKLAITLEHHPQLPELTPASLQSYADALMTANVSSLVLDAQVQFAQRKFDLAATTCEKELRLKPTSLDALRLLGKSLLETGDYARAEIALHAAEQIAPGDAQTISDIAHCLVMQGKHDDALACFDDARDHDAGDITATAQHLHDLAFMGDAHWQTRAQVEAQFLARAEAIGIEAMADNATLPGGKIRIAILSSHFYSCDEALVLETFLKNYNRNRFEVFCLQQSITNDKTTDRFKTLCDSWRPVFDLDDWVLASIVSGDGIQALIDLNGYGPGQRRATLGAKPAPLQVAWLNHLDGTGKHCINLILADNATLETDRRTLLDGQEIAKLESGLFAFEPFGILADVTSLPALEHETISFGAYVDMGRVSPQIARTWSNLLAAVPNALLVLNVTPQLTPEAQAQLSARFAHFGCTKRIVFMSDTPDEPNVKHANAETDFLSGVDVLLDTGVNSSAGQIARSLWMGVPVLTHDTGRRSGQVGASVLMAAGKGEWVAKDTAELIAAAQALTADFSALDAVRQSLRDAIKDSALFQGRVFAREIETAIEMALEDKGIL